MADVPSIAKRIQVEEVDDRSPDSEATMFKVGGVINFILDHYIIPVGTVIDWIGLEASIPAGGWDVPDGREVPRAFPYDTLFAQIGDLCGIGNGVSTWNLPDIRGAVTRMVSTTSEGASGRDPDESSRTVDNGGADPADPVSYQSDGFASHTHRVGQQSGGSGAPTWQSSGDAPNNQQSGPTGGNETRMKNVYVFKLIKL